MAPFAGDGTGSTDDGGFSVWPSTGFGVWRAGVGDKVFCTGVDAAERGCGGYAGGGPCAGARADGVCG